MIVLTSACSKNKPVCHGRLRTEGCVLPAAANIMLKKSAQADLEKLLHFTLKSYATTLYVCMQIAPDSETTADRACLYSSSLSWFTYAHSSLRTLARPSLAEMLTTLSSRFFARPLLPLHLLALLPHFQHPLPLRIRLVSDLDQVISQLLNSVRSSSGLNSLRVVCDEDRLCSLDQNNAFTSLQISHISMPFHLSQPHSHFGVISPSCHIYSGHPP